MKTAQFPAIGQKLFCHGGNPVCFVNWFLIAFVRAVTAWERPDTPSSAEVTPLFPPNERPSVAGMVLAESDFIERGGSKSEAKQDRFARLKKIKILKNGHCASKRDSARNINDNRVEPAFNFHARCGSVDDFS